MGTELPSGFWRDHRAHYPLLKELAYLNNASIQPLPLPVAQRLQDFVRAACEGNPEDLHDPAAYSRLRVSFSRWLGCAPDDLAFISSTSDGVIKAVNAIPWRPGDEALVPLNEFPSVRYPFQMPRAGGVEVRPAGRPGEVVREEDVLAALTARTRAVAFSWVSFSTGYRMDLAPLAKEIKRRGVEFVIVDGMQGAGVWNPDLAATAVDFFAFQAVKWFAGPNGIGALYIRPGLLRGLRDSAFSWYSVPCCEDLTLLTDTGLTPFGTARRFDGGTPVLIAAVGVQAYLDLLEPAGVDGVTARMRELLAALGSRLAMAGIGTLLPVEGPHASSIVLLDVGDPAAVQERLRAAGVATSVRMGRIRVSPHVYNDEEDFDRLVAAVRGRP